jgi:hypothetical protein
VKAAQATAQWEQHLQREEEERRLYYDHQHEKEHETVLAGLEQAKRRIDGATTNAALATAAAAAKASLPELRKHVAAIDPHRQSSSLLADYDAILAALDGPYAAARSASLRGDDGPARVLRADLERRLAKARAWLTAGKSPPG